MALNSIKSKGQYFTPRIIADFMISLISFTDSIEILEPSAGEGIFLQSLAKSKNFQITGIEIDEELHNKSNHEILYQDFFDFPAKKFDVVIGNPPYIRWKHQSKDRRKELLERSFWGKRMNGLTDMLQPFIFKSIDHLKPNGELIFITPKFWLQTLHSAPLRDFMINKGHLELIIDFHEKKIFRKSSLNLIIFKFIKHKKNKFTKFVKFMDKTKIQKEDLTKVQEALSKLDEINREQIINYNIFQAFWAKAPIKPENWYFIPLSEEKKIEILESSCKYSPIITFEVNGKKQLLPLNRLLSKEDLIGRKMNKNDYLKAQFNSRKYYIENRTQNLTKFIKSEMKPTKLIERPIRLRDIAEIGNGMVSGLDKAFKIDKAEAFNPKEEKCIIDVIKSSSLNQYYSEGTTKYIFIEEGSIETEKNLKEEFPKIYEKLTPFIDKLKKRWTPHQLNWWEWAFPRNKKLLERNKQKIFVPCKDRFDQRRYVRFAYEEGPFYAAQDITVIIKDLWVKEAYEYLVAYLNSKIIFDYLINKGLVRGGVLEFSEKPLSEIPIRLINWEREKEVSIHNQIVDLVYKIKTYKSDEMTKKLKIKIEKLFEELISNEI
ncbi:MAG: Eco57I restriction-modification methylase domain-containing protein [Candidatus Hodarchaeota archaeon]